MSDAYGVLLGDALCSAEARIGRKFSHLSYNSAPT